MKKLVAAIVIVVVLLIGYIAAGPFLTINAIRSALKEQNSAELAEQVDFPALRTNIKAQLDDQLVRRAGADAQSNLFGAIALRIAGGLSGAAADAVVTPAGLAALMQGRSFLHRIRGGGIRDDDAYAHQPPPDPLKDASYGFESTSRFTATVRNGDGEPVVFVLSRDGLSWKLTDIRLPL